MCRQARIIALQFKSTRTILARFFVIDAPPRQIRVELHAERFVYLAFSKLIKAHGSCFGSAALIITNNNRSPHHHYCKPCFHPEQ
jgi:hypothetical protein